MNPFDIETTDDPKEDSSPSKDQGAQGKGQEPEASDAPPSDASGLNDRIAALERKLGEVSDQNVALTTELATARSQVTSKDDAEEDPRWSKEDLKKFGLEDGGKQQFDAATHYVDQRLAEFEKQFGNSLRSEYRTDQTQRFTEEYMLELYPDLKDPNSQFSKRVLSEQSRLLATGHIDPTLPDAKTRAYGLALHRVGTSFPQNNGGESGTDYATRRRVEESGAVGAPTGGREPGDKGPAEMSKDEVATLNSMLGKDASPEARKAYLSFKAKYERARI